MDNVRDALNKANLAIRKYFTLANDVGVGTAESVLAGPKEDAVHAIMEFANAKRAAGEMRLTPYEEKCLGVMDAANEIAAYKTNINNLDHCCECGHYGEGCCSGQFQTH